MATNSFGLDVAYFYDKVGLVLRDLGHFTPEELARTLARLARTACEEVLGEAEFSGQAAPVAVPDGWREVIENARDSIGAGALQENANTERRYVEPYLDGIYDELEALEKAAAPAAPAPAAQEPEDAPTPPEVLASRMIDVWVEAHGRKIPWAHAVQIIGTITKLPREEVDRLLAMDDTAPTTAEQPDTVKVPRELLERGVNGTAEESLRAVRELRALLGKEGEA